MKSRFADLLIINPRLNFDKKDDGEVSAFANDVLAKSECPVLIAPAVFNGIDEVIFTYDGGAAAAFAVRQFANLFPELNEEKILVLQVNEHLKPADEQNLKQYLGAHYSNVNFHLLKGKASPELLKFLSKREKALVVMGAYSRTKISRSFIPSTAEKLIKTFSTPIFIAHH